MRERMEEYVKVVEGGEYMQVFWGKCDFILHHEQWTLLKHMISQQITGIATTSTIMYPLRYFSELKIYLSMYKIESILHFIK